MNTNGQMMREIGLQEAAAAGTPLTRKVSEAFAKRVAEKMNLITDAFHGDYRARLALHEALSTSDFPLLVGHGLNAMLLAAYKAVEPTWRKYIHVGDPLKDFRAAERYRATRGSGILSEIGENGSIKYDAQDESKYSFVPKVYAGARAITFQMLINDDLGAVRRTPDDMAWQAANTEQWFASNLFVANTTLFATSGDGRPTGGNKLTLPFSAPNLKTALAQYAKFRDDSSVPMLNRPKYLVHPPALRMDVAEVLNSALVVPGSGATEDRVPTSNVLQNILEPVENPWIPYLDPVNGDKSWYIFSDLNDGWAVDLSFMQGYEAPLLFMKSPDRMLLTGEAAQGSFDNGGVSYGAQHIFGGSHTNAVGGWRFGLWSDGSGA